MLGDIATKIESSSAQRVNDGIVLPLIISCSKSGLSSGEVAEWVSKNQQELEQLLYRHGAVLFRGFPISEAEHFGEFVSAFKGWKDLPYEDSLSYAVRMKVNDRVCTTNEGKTGGMVFHHEQAQAPKYPTKAFFYCQKAAEEGGATGVSPSDVLLKRLEERYPDFVKECEEKGVIYSAALPPEQDASKGAGRSWKSFFHCDTKQACEKRMQELGYKWSWEGDDLLRVSSPVLPAVIIAPGSGKRVFFNQMAAQYSGNAKEFSQQAGDSKLNIDDYLTFGDGSSVNCEALEYADQLSKELAIDVNWQTGDIALLDNYQVMHARRAFEGVRKIYASFAL